MSTHTITCSKQELEILLSKLSKATTLKTPPYALFSKKVEGCTITAYQSGKVVFQGNEADFYATSLVANQPTEKPKTTTTQQSVYPMSGSDEVGTGDYFGPVVVVACTVNEALATKLQPYHITDSKLMKDETILQIVPSIIPLVPHSKLVLPPLKYNEVHQRYNMNAIKALLHNQAYLHLAKKLDAYPPNIIIDQFCTPQLYFKYLKDEKEVVSNIHFETKAESKYLAVALSSILARYYFLKAFDELSQIYDFPFHKGASHKVDAQIKTFVARFGRARLEEVAKTHYANTEKALNER